MDLRPARRARLVEFCPILGLSMHPNEHHFFALSFFERHSERHSEYHSERLMSCREARDKLQNNLSRDMRVKSRCNLH
jgi:hypothetical protein